MPKRFLQTDYEKLTKAELIEAVYTIGDKYGKLATDLIAKKQKLTLARAQATKLKQRNTQLHQTMRQLRQRVAELTPPVKNPL